MSDAQTRAEREADPTREERAKRDVLRYLDEALTETTYLDTGGGRPFEAVDHCLDDVKKLLDGDAETRARYDHAPPRTDEERTNVLRDFRALVGAYLHDETAVIGSVLAGRSEQQLTWIIGAGLVHAAQLTRMLAAKLDLDPLHLWELMALANENPDALLASLEDAGEDDPEDAA